MKKRKELRDNTINTKKKIQLANDKLKNVEKDLKRKRKELDAIAHKRLRLDKKLPTFNLNILMISIVIFSVTLNLLGREGSEGN